MLAFAAAAARSGTLEAVRELNIAPAAKELILGGNAARLFRLSSLEAQAPTTGAVEGEKQ